MSLRSKRAAAAVALSLSVGLAACNQPPVNTTLYSTNQPVVERNNFTLDLAAGADGLRSRNAPLCALIIAVRTVSRRPQRPSFLHLAQRKVGND